MIEPILITGCARSGTSMVAGTIHMCGAFGGKMSGPNRHNKRGMFENAEIRQTVTKPYLRDLGVDPLGQYPLPDVAKIPIPNDWKQRVESVFVDQGYSCGPWMYKGAKMCLFWPVWHHAYPNAKWIIVRRKTEDIVRSCLKTGFMRAFSHEGVRARIGVSDEVSGWTWWVDQHIQRFTEMIEAGLNVKVVWPERMVNGDYKQIYEAIEWLGLEWESKVLSFIDPQLWKARR